MTGGSPLILPGDIEFECTVNSILPPTQQGDAVFIQRPGSLLLEAVSPEEAHEYLGSGEYDERLLEMGDDFDPEEL
jgi:hypothetical protein